VVVAQIRSGLWVRNGYSIRNQAHHYRDLSLRDAAYDNDIFLVQAGFAILGPNLMLATLLDRFELADWVNNLQQTNTTYDAFQSIFMAEEMLYLIILVVSEVSRAINLSEEESIAREIRHATHKPIAYSELTRRVLERSSSHPKFDDILRKLCKFHPPDHTSDHGRYELRPDQLQFVDVYYIYYSRNQRSEADETLKAHYSKLGKPYVHVLPVPKITIGPFQRIGNVLHTPGLCQILFASIWSAMQDPRANTDTLVDESLHLILLALSDPNNDLAVKYGKEEAAKYGFIRHAWEMRFPVPPLKNAGSGSDTDTPAEKENVCLVDLLLHLLTMKNLSDHHVKARYIIEQIEAKSPDAMAEYIRNWRENQQRNAEADLAESKRAKNNARELQAKIMSEFAEAQKNFMSNYAHLMDDDDDDYDDDEDLYGETTAAGEASAEQDAGTAMETGMQDAQYGEPETNEEKQHVWEFPLGTCMVCKEETTPNTVYGMLGLVQPSSHLRYTRLDNNDQMLEALDLPSRLDVDLSKWREEQAAAGAEGKTWLGRGKPWHRRPGLVISTCGHFVHLKCFESYVSAIQQRQALQPARNHPEDILRKEYMCPLCRSLGNMFIPMFGRRQREKVPRLHNSSVASLEAWLDSHLPALLETLTPPTAPEQTVEENVSPETASSSSHSSRSGHTDVHTVFSGRLELPAHIMQELVRISNLTGRLPLSMTRIFNDILRSTVLSTSDAAMAPLEHLTIEHVSDIIGWTPDDDGLKEVKRTFIRFFEVPRTLRSEVGIDWFEHVPCNDTLDGADLLSDMYGYTICCMEILERGVSVGNNADEELLNDPDYTTSVLDTVPPAMRNLLRYLSESVSTYIKFLSKNPTKENALRAQAVACLKRLTEPVQNETESKVLLHEDLFLLFVRTIMLATGRSDLNVWHLMQTFYVAELVKNMIGLVDQMLKGNNLPTHWVHDSHFTDWLSSPMAADIQTRQATELEALNKIAYMIFADSGIENATSPLEKINHLAFYKLTRTFVLPFLRRCALLVSTRFSIQLPNLPKNEVDNDEFDQLRRQLGLPSFAELYQILACNGSLRNYVHLWCTQHFKQDALFKEQNTNNAEMKLTGIFLQQPTVYELIPLPAKLDRLFELTMMRTCLRCKQRPIQPALCLVCGKLLCAQSFCCSSNTDGGECYRHMSR
jgi:E3 ubiquitin-protein ligase UBR1